MKNIFLLALFCWTVFAGAQDVTRDHFERSLTSTIAFWTSPEVIDPAWGYHAWFDSKFRKIPSSPESPSNTDANRPLIVQLRILYDHACALSRDLDPTEKIRIQAQYEYGKQALKRYRLADSNLYATALFENGKPVNSEPTAISQIYLLYILAECARMADDPEAARWSQEVLEATGKAFFDPEFGGYFEQLHRSKTEPASRIKSVGTQIHAVLGLASLYRTAPDEKLKNQLLSMLDLVTSGKLQYPNGNGALNVSADFKNLEALPRPAEKKILYGHNAEMVWYSLEGIKGLNLPFDRFRPWADKTAKAVLNYGMFEDGQMAIYGPTEGHGSRPPLVVWWIQLETMNLCAAMYEQTGDEFYRKNFNRLAAYSFDTMVTEQFLWQNEWSISRKQYSIFGGRGWKSGLHVIRSMKLITESKRLWENQR